MASPETPGTTPQSWRLSTNARRRFAQLISLAAFVAIAWYVFDRRDELAAAFESSTGDLVALFALCLAGQILNASEFWVLYRSSPARIGYFEQLHLYDAGQLGNYLPFQVGSLYRLRYLKVVHQLEYAAAVGPLAMNVLVSIASTAACGLLGVVGYAVAEDGSLSWVLLVIFGAMLALAVAGALLPLPPRLVSRPSFRRHWEEFHRGWEALRRRPSTGLMVLGLDMVKLLVLALRFQLAFDMLGVEESFFLFLVIGPVAAFTSAYAPTPGGLGVREAAVGGAAGAMGASIPTGILAATVDRAVALVVTVVLGAVGYWWTVRTMRRHRDGPAAAPT